MTSEKLEARKKERAARKEAARIEAERNQKPVKQITITIEWVRSRTWGHNPHAEAQIQFQDGTWDNSPVFRCSGCGYDKKSTVIAEVFNHYLLYKLWAMTPEQIKGGHGTGDKGNAPYGICCYTEGHRHYAGGIGAECYRAISEYISGKWECVADTKTVDVFRYTDEVAK